MPCTNIKSILVIITAFVQKILENELKRIRKVNYIKTIKTYLLKPLQILSLSFLKNFKR